jgi:MoaA/NifB/PqqE/SkfB family radical SAM enzyme
LRFEGTEIMKNLKPQSVLSHAVIMLHPGCNMACSFCITNNSFDVMSLDKASQLLTYLKGVGMVDVILGGGEPFAWTYDLLSLANQAKEMGFMVQVGTNGIALPKNFENQECIDRYILPLESMDENTHNTMRFYKSRHHSLILHRLAQLKNSQKEVTLSTVVTRHNVNDLDQTAEYLREYQASGGQIHAWHLYQFIPEGRGGKLNATSLSISPANYFEACQRIKQKELGFTVYRRNNMYQSQTVGFFWFQDGKLQCNPSASQFVQVQNQAQLIKTDFACESERM